MFSLRESLLFFFSFFFCNSLVKQPDGDCLAVVCAAWSHVTLVFAVMRLYNISEFLLFLHSIPFWSSFFFFFNLVLISQTVWSTLPACPSLLCFATKMCVSIIRIYKTTILLVPIEIKRLGRPRQTSNCTNLYRKHVCTGLTHFSICYCWKYNPKKDMINRLANISA